MAINSRKIHFIRFTNNITLMAEYEVDLNFMLNVLDATKIKVSLKINIKKTKVLVVSRSGQHNTANIKIKNESVEQVKKFCYLGSLITEDSGSIKEVREE